MSLLMKASKDLKGGRLLQCVCVHAHAFGVREVNALI